MKNQCSATSSKEWEHLTPQPPAPSYKQGEKEKLFFSWKGEFLSPSPKRRGVGEGLNWQVRNTNPINLRRKTHTIPLTNRQKNISGISSIFNRTLIIAIALGICTSGCQTSTTNETASHQPKVVSTSTILTDLTEKIGGDEIELKGILKPGADPHVYEPVPADNQALEKAELILYNGYDLEPGLIKLMNSSGVKAKKVPVGEVVKPLDFNYKGATKPDPHVWGNAKNAIAMVNVIRDSLIELSPEDKAEFTENAAKLTAELEKVDTWIAQQIQTIPENQRQLVTTHDAFQYYAQSYGLKVTGTLIGISTEEQPSAQTVKRLSEAIKSAGVPAIFAETTINPALITTVAQEAKVKLAPRQLYSDSIGAPGSEGDTYVKMLVANTHTIVESLGGKYTEFK